MNTPATSADAIERLRAQITDVMSVDSTTVLRQPAEAVMFRGRLQTDSDTAFGRVQPRFDTLGYTPSLQHSDGQDVLTAIPGKPVVQPSNPWINLILFIATVASTFYTGAADLTGLNVLNGILFSVSILTILGAHEFGHYFVARYYKAPVTLPYFIPLPLISPIGTMGAVIRLKAPFVNRKSLFDVGIAGPLAGLVFAIPILFIGLSMSTVSTCPAGVTCFQEGNSIVYALAKFMVFGKFLPAAGGLDVQLSPVAWAGWVGLFITALNLLPAGQLDGGHIVFGLLGKNARYLGIATVVLLTILALPAILPDLFSVFGLPTLIPRTIDLSFLGIPGLNYPGYFGWIVWVGLIYFTGVNHPIPLNAISDLGWARRILGIITIVIFVLLFTPLPFSQ